MSSSRRRWQTLHAEHAEQKAWIGGDFDPKEFSVDEVNRRLTPEVY